MVAEVTERKRQRFENAALLALMGDGKRAMGQEMQVACRRWKRKEADSPLEPLEEKQPCQRLDFHPF